MIVHPLTDDDLANRGQLATRADVELLVRPFYRYAAMDELLRPIFSAAHVNWDAHVATPTDFWAWQLLGERGYTGHPLRAHEPVHARTPFGLRASCAWQLAVANPRPPRMCTPPPFRSRS